MNFLSKIFKSKSEGANIILSHDGPHSIGGRPGPDFELPHLETSPIIYLGLLKKGEPALEQLDFDVHLICPIFIDFRIPVFFNYSDHNRPSLIRENVESNFNQYFDDIHQSSYIEYKKLKFRFKKTKSTDDIFKGKIGHMGTPNWIHDEVWPNCPITGNKMKFLIQLGDIDDCTTTVGQDILDKEHLGPYLSFGHGYLYVFYEPESKVIAYLNQL